jgi:PAS domain S-box-containing protein
MIRKETINKKRHKLLQAFSLNSPVYELFDCIEHVSFFAKDRDGVLLAANRYLVELYEFRSEDELIGNTDFDLLPRRLAEKFRHDDLQIMKSGKPARKIVELFLNRQGIPSWFLTSKYPIRSAQGKTIGIMGIIQDYDARKDLFAEEPELRTALAHLHDHFREKVSIQTLAKSCQLSLRQFERRFQAKFNLSPQQYLIKLRIQEACEQPHAPHTNHWCHCIAFGFL